MVNLLLFGLGAVGRALLLVLARERPRWLTADSALLVVDREDLAGLVDEMGGIRDQWRSFEFIRCNVTRRNYREKFTEWVRRFKPSIVVDATYNVHTLSLLKLFSELDVPYMNSSIELWGEDEPDDVTATSAESQSLWHRQEAIREAKLAGKATALVDMGTNPGLISAMTKRAVRRFHRAVFGKLPADIPLAAARLDVRAAIVAELDSQVSNRPRAPGEFVNTWSPDGFCEEAFAPTEATDREIGPVVDPTLSYYNLTFARVPSGYISGFSIRHSEAITIGRLLQGPAAAPPATVWYCYRSCDLSIASLFEAQNAPANQRWKTKRTMYEEIVSGTDELGILLVSPKHGAYWYGPVQSIEECRRLFPGKERWINITTLQTASGYYAGLSWVLENPGRGVVYPEALDDDYVFDLTEHLLAPLYDGALEFDMGEKPPRRAGERRGTPGDAYGFAAFLI